MLQHSLATCYVEAFHTMRAAGKKVKSKSKSKSKDTYQPVRQFETAARRLERPGASFAAGYFAGKKVPAKIMALQAGGVELLAQTLAGCAGRAQDIAHSHGNDAPILACLSKLAHVLMYFVSPEAVPPSLKTAVAFAKGDYEHQPARAVEQVIPTWKVTLEDGCGVRNLRELRHTLKKEVVGDSAYLEAVQLGHLIGVAVHDSWPTDHEHEETGWDAAVSKKELKARKESVALLECFVRALIGCQDPTVRAGATSVWRRAPACIGVRVPVSCRCRRWR